MKQIFVVLLVISWFAVAAVALGQKSAQAKSGATKTNTAEDVGHPLQFSNVVEVSGQSSTNLYLQAKLWFASTYKDSKCVLEVEDKDAGILAGKGTFRYEPNVFISSGPVRGFISYQIRVLVKEGKFKYEFSNFTHAGSLTDLSAPISFGLVTDSATPPPMKNTTKAWREKVWLHIQSEVSRTAAELAESLKKQMSSKGDDW